MTDPHAKADDSEANEFAIASQFGALGLVAVVAVCAEQAFAVACVAASTILVHAPHAVVGISLDARIHILPSGELWLSHHSLSNHKLRSFWKHW